MYFKFKVTLPALLISTHRFKFVVFVAKSSAISSKVDAILSFSAKFLIITAGDRMIAGASKLWPVRDWI